jgi:GntR family transcriptional regulator / MocR family aminotransferase
MNRTSQATELLLSVTRTDPAPLGTQIEDQLRAHIRSGALRPNGRLPSTRDLARQLGVSRGVVVNAYAQLGAEGYLVLRRGARPRVCDAVASPAAEVDRNAPPSPPRFDFRPSLPDVSTFPRQAWLRSFREAVSSASDADLGYGDARGIEPLHRALADYLGRVRGVVADPAQIVVTSGYTQGQGVVCRALAAAGARRIAVEDPSDPEEREIVARAGLEVVPVGVDDGGLRIDKLERTGADAVILSPAHQFPTGAVLAGERRNALLEWLGRADAIAIEDDYDAEYRYDRSPVGALQGRDPDRVVYAASASKTLAPALRLGWLVVPPRLVDRVAREKRLADRGTARIEQHAFADFLLRGELDRHLRRMRALYRTRRDLLIETLSQRLPEVQVEGIAAGLHVTVRLLETDHEEAIVDEAARRGIALEGMGEYRAHAGSGHPTVLIGYGQSPEPKIRPGIDELADAIQATRRSG